MADVFTELAVKLRGPNPGTDEAQVTSTAGGALQVEEVANTYTYDEDTVHTDGDTGAFVLGVRNDTLAALAGTDGDYAPFQVDASGALYVNVSNTVTISDGGGSITIDDGGVSIAINDDGGSITVDGTVTITDGGGSITVDGTVDTNFQYAEDSVHTSADIGAFVLAVRNDAGTALAADGDYIPFTTDSTGALRISGTFMAGNEYAEDTVHTDGDTGGYVLSVREDTLATSTTADGDYQSFKTDSLGRLWVNQRGVYAEDSVHTDADEGQFVLAVRNDTLAALAGTDGDYAPLQVDANGALWVTGGTDSEYAEDTVHTDGDIGSFVLAVRNDTLATLAGTDGDYAPFQVDADGAVYVAVDDRISLASEYAEDSIHTSADVGQFVLGVRADTGNPLAADGDYIPFTMDSTGRLRVDAEFNSAFDYAEDSVHTDGDQGAYVLSVREDTLATSTTADGDYQSFKTDSLGRLWVTQRGVFAEDSVHTDADEGQFILAVRNDTLAALAGTDGDYAPFQVDASGALYVNISNASVTVDDGGGSITIDDGGVSIAINDDGGSITVDGTVTITDGGGSITVDGAVDVTSNFEYTEDSVHTDADIGAFVLAVRNDTLAALAGTDGDYAPFQVDADGALYVAVDDRISLASEYAEDSIHTSADVGQFVLAVRNDAGTALAADGDYIPFTTDSTGALRVAASVTINAEYAEDSVHTDGDTGSYVLSVREDTLATSTTASGDYQSFKTDSLGRLWVNQRGVFAEDSVHTDADEGQFVLAVRNDTLAALAGTDGDYAPFQVNASGALYTEVSSLSIGHVDDSAFTVGTDEVSASGYLYDDTATDTVDEGDIGIARMTDDRRQLMRIGGNTDANRVNVDDGSMMLVDRIQDTSVVHEYGTVSSVANNSTGTITYTVAENDVFYLKQVIAASSGAPMKVVIQYDDGGVTTLATLFYSDAAPYIDVTFDQPVPITGVAGGTDVEVVITNRAGPAQDIYATIMGRTADLT